MFQVPFLPLTFPVVKRKYKNELTVGAGRGIRAPPFSVLCAHRNDIRVATHPRRLVPRQAMIPVTVLRHCVAEFSGRWPLRSEPVWPATP